MFNPFNPLNPWSYQSPLREPLKATAAVGYDVKPCHFHDVGKRLGLPPAVGVHERHALVTFRVPRQTGDGYNAGGYFV